MSGMQVDLRDRKFGTLTPIEWRPGRKWVCRCDCGSVKEYWHINLTAGRNKFCGKDCPLNSHWHGHSGHETVTREYRTWGGMLARCFNKNNRAYKNYGARGITVCERWLTYANFLADMGPKPPGMSIDRIDNNGDYTPDNCRWATPSQQLRNTRLTKLNETVVGALRRGEMSIKEAAAATGSHYTVAWKAKTGQKWA